MIKGEEPRELSTLQRALDKVLLIQQPLIARHVERLKRSRPGCTPADIVSVLEKQYISALAASGAAVGGAAVAPGVLTGVSIALSAGETLTSLEATVMYILGVSEVHGIAVHDIERRRTLLLAILLGDSGTKFVEKATQRTGQYWAKEWIKSIPMSQINQINRVLGPRFITKYGTRQGVLVLGRALPFGIGVAVGALGNFVVARGVVAGTQRAFGAPPAKFLRVRSTVANRPRSPRQAEPEGSPA
jgi:hypothetical protein